MDDLVGQEDEELEAGDQDMADVYRQQAASTTASCQPRLCSALTGLLQDAGVDDLIGGEDEELEAGDQDMADVYRQQALHRQREKEMTAEEVEAYVKSRFQQPTMRDAGDTDADAGSSQSVKAAPWICP